MKKVVIIGAGLAGLATAYALNKRADNHAVTLLEKDDRPGGLCKTIEKEGFLFDQTGHLLHFQKENFKQFILQMLPGQLNELQRSAWIYSYDVFTHYPFQANLFGLPPEIITECLYGYCQAAFRPTEMHLESFEDWILAYLGSGIAKHFMMPYNTKLFKRHPSELTPDCMGRFIPKPDPLQVIRGAVSDRSESLGYNASFYYPKQGGIETLIKAIASNVTDIRTNQQVQTIDLAMRRIRTVSGETYDFDHLISSAPLPELIQMIQEAPHFVKEAAKSLEHVSVLNVNLGVRETIREKHWIYLPEERFISYRVGFAHNFTQHMAPPGCGSIYAEISYRPGHPPNIDQTLETVISDLLAMKILSDKNDVISQAVIDIPYAYVIFNRRRQQALQIIRDFLKEHGLFSIGRFGRWEYTSMEDAFLDGMATATEL